MLVQFLVSFLPLFLIARAILGKFVPSPIGPMEGEREDAKGPGSEPSSAAMRADDRGDFAEDKEPFRLLDLPPELVLRILHLLDESTTRPPILGGNDSASRPSLPHVSCGRRHTVNALALTCRDLHALCRPLFRRWLVIRTPLPRVPASSDLENVGESADLLGQLPIGLKRPIQNTLVRLETAALSPSSTTAFWYHGPSRIELYGRVLWNLEHRTPLAASLHSAVIALSHLTYLHLEGISDRLASACLSLSPPTLEAVSLSYILAAGPTPASDLVIPSLPNLVAIKLFECPHEWLQLVAPATQLKHLVIWLPSDGFPSMDWLPPDHLNTIVTLNLDGFRYRPKFLIALCDMIKVRRRPRFSVIETDPCDRRTRPTISTLLCRSVISTSKRHLHLTDRTSCSSTCSRPWPCARP